MKLGEFLSNKRKERGIPLRQFAIKIGISPSFLCDLESGYRSFPSENKMNGLFEKIASALQLNDEEVELFRMLIDEAMLENGKLPNAISAYLQEVPEAQLALRKAKDKGLGKDAWKAFVDSMEGKK